MLDGGDGSRDPDCSAACSPRPTRAASAASRPARARCCASAGSRLRVLAPAPRPPGAPPPEDPNPRGVAAIVSAGSFDLLLSADAESGAILPLRAAARSRR